MVAVARAPDNCEDARLIDVIGRKDVMKCEIAMGFQPPVKHRAEP